MTTTTEAKTEAKTIEEITQHLPDWTPGIRQYDHGGDIKHVSGANIFIRLDGGKGGKGSAHGSFPKDEEGTWMSARSWGLIAYDADDNCEIGFSPKKGPKLIARDLERRLIPVYLPMYQAAKRKLEENTTLKYEREGRLNVLAEIVDEQIFTGPGDRGFSKYDEENYSLRCSANYGGTFRIHLDSLSFELAQKVLKLLAKP